MVWVLGGLVVWVTVAAVLALTIGRAVDLADQRSVRTHVWLDAPGEDPAVLRVPVSAAPPARPDWPVRMPQPRSG
ncbi:hypothetical protein [Blastococcus sp. SYSU DS0973]